MAATRTTLKQYFKKYATPTEEQFAALIDAFVHKDEDSLTQSKIDGLTAALNDKVSSSELQTAVEAAVAETLQGGNLEVTPAAHEHAVSDISGLGARLTTLETSKADYEAFKTLVTAFLNDADVSDTTINRWKELEDFLSGITDSDTLAGMLQALKAEILAEVPQPQTGNYLEQVTDMAAALQTAEVGKIVQYVGQSDAEYTRGFCYEKGTKTETANTHTAVMTITGDNGTYDSDGSKDDIIEELIGQKFYLVRRISRRCYGMAILLKEEGDPEIGDLVWLYASGAVLPIIEVTPTSFSLGSGLSYNFSTLSNMNLYELNNGVLSNYFVSNSSMLPCTAPQGAGLFLPDRNTGVSVNASYAEEDIDIHTEVPTWQPIITSPAVS